MVDCVRSAGKIGNQSQTGKYFAASQRIISVLDWVFTADRLGITLCKVKPELILLAKYAEMHFIKYDQHASVYLASKVW